MREELRFAPHKVSPSIRSILEAQGIPHDVEPDVRTRDLIQEAFEIFEATAEPVGLLLPIEKELFSRIFFGESLNEDNSPVGNIAGKADRLALFVATLGSSVCTEISRAFGKNDFPIGSMLDSVASEAADRAAQTLEDVFRLQLHGEGGQNSGQGTLRFSPGYCGWHMSAQRALFQALKPETIGITLNQSYLMEPIKSVSGVIIAGKKNIFQFDDTFAFCADCTTHSCRERISRVAEQ